MIAGIMDKHINENREDRLTDEELARLMDPALDPEIRKVLVEKLDRDPDSAGVLGLAAGDIPGPTDNLPPKTVEMLLDTVKNYDSDPGICPHCTSDLHDSGNFCPHCGLQVRGDTVNCMTCGCPVVEGSAYCPNCGSMFGEIKRKPLIDTRWLMFLIAFVSIAIAIALVPTPSSIIFLLIGLIALLGWLGEFLGVYKRAQTGKSHIVKRTKISKDKDHDDTGKKSG